LITMHFEYAPTGKPGSDEEKALLAAIRQDKAFLLDALEKAGIETT
jgi:hypothetical protein